MITVVDPKKHPGPAGATNVLAAPFGEGDAKRSLGPFAVVVHVRMPASAPGALPVDVDVRPHPHIGLTAISFVLEGSITHRDSLGNRRELSAGDLGVTVGGRGIVHSERFERIRLLGGAFEMFQLLLASPDGLEDGEPSFFARATEVTGGDESGVRVRWLFPASAVPAGIPTKTPILLADVTMDAGATWPLPDAPERALYVREGELAIDDVRVRAGQVAVVSGEVGSVRAIAAARVLAFGGTNPGPRHLWWNYLHSSVDRIAAAKAEWRASRVKLPDGDTESFTPCPPDDGRPLVRLNGG